MKRITFEEHSKKRHRIACCFTLAELEFLTNMVTAYCLRAHSPRCFATNDNDKPQEERMRIVYVDLLDELTTDLKRMKEMVYNPNNDPTINFLNALGY